MPKIKVKGVSRKTLIKNTPSRVRDSLEEVVVKKFKFAETIAGYREGSFLVKSKMPTTKRKPPEHRCILLRTNKKKDLYWVHCSCEYFMFNLEYALAQHGASAIINSNGQPAKQTNPNNTPYLCRHLWKLIKSKRIKNKMEK